MLRSLVGSEMCIRDRLNNNKEIDGFIVQLPLPKHIDEQKILLSINPNKDVDGFHPTNFGKMALNMETFIPATPYGIMELLKRYKIETKGKHTVVIGRSHIVGRPISILMNSKGAVGDSTVTVTHSRTTDIESYIKKADIVVSALGIPGFVKKNMDFKFQNETDRIIEIKDIPPKSKVKRFMIGWN